MNISIGPSGQLPGDPHCPKCHAGCDGYTGLGKDGAKITPAPGDATICVYCAAILTFDDKMELRLATVAEMSDYMNDPVFMMALMGIQMMIARRRKNAH